MVIFAVSVGWSMYMTILYKHRICHEKLSENINIININIIKIDGQNEFSNHHTNIMILQYKNGIRVIVSTADLYPNDWKNRTQGSVKYIHLNIFIVFYCNHMIFVYKLFIIS